MIRKKVLLKEYNRLCEEIEYGTLIGIPCKIGSFIYRVRNNKVFKEPDKCEVVGMWLSANPKCSRVNLYCYKGPENWYTIELPLSEFDKSLFINKKDALNKMKIK